MKGTTGIGCTVRRWRRKQPRYMPGLCVVKLRRQKDTRALVCNILKPREINYPGALMNYELCLRSWKRFITSKSSLEYGEHHLISFPPWTPQIPVNYYFEFNGMFPLLCLVQRSKKAPLKSQLVNHCSVLTANGSGIIVCFFAVRITYSWIYLSLLHRQVLLLHF